MHGHHVHMELKMVLIIRQNPPNRGGIPSAAAKVAQEFARLSADNERLRMSNAVLTDRLKQAAQQLNSLQAKLMKARP